MGAKTASTKGLVYICDDEPLLVEMADAILQMEGYSTKQFHSAEAALEELSRSEPPQLIVTDWLMGGMTGIELISQMKQRVPGVRTILLSGTIEEAAIEKHSTKPDKFLAKPYQVQSLINAVNAIMRAN